MFVHLSHKLDPLDGAFPGEPLLVVKQDSIASPDAKPFNSTIATLPNHVETHMDGPHHFDGPDIPFADLDVKYFGYEGHEVLVVELPERGEAAEVITKEDIEPYAEQLKGKRLLLIKTNFTKYKFTQPKIYEEQGVSLHPEFSKYLNENFPELDCIGMDFLSIGSPTNDYGPEAHRWLLGNYTDHIICGIEDMDLQAVDASTVFKAVTLGPLRIKGIDSSQVNVMAWIED